MISISPKNFKEKAHLKTIDEELIDSKDRLSDIIKFLPDATFVIDSAGVVIAWNHAMEELTQVKADEMLGKDRYEYSLPFYGKRRKILIDLVLSSNKEVEEKYDGIWWDGSSITAEIFIPSLNGKPTYLWGKATSLYDQKEVIVGAIESIRDITNKKQAEKELEEHRGHLEELVKERTEELREINEQLQIEIKKRKQIYQTLKQSEVKYKTIFENTGAATLIFEEDTSISLVNSEFEKLSGWSQEDVEGKSWSEFVIGDNLDELIDYHNKRTLEPDSAPKKYEFRFLRKDKSIGFGYGTIVIIPGTSQRIASVIDITELKRAENELKKSEEEYHSLYSSMSEGVALHDIIYNSDLEPVDYIITDVNPAYEKIIGLNRSEAVGKRASELYGTEYPPYIEIYASVADSGEPVQFETYFKHVDKYFRVSVVSHNIGKFATFFEDITQRKKAENAKSELSSIVESSEDAIIGRDLDERITSWNKGAERLYGYSKEDALGRNISFLIPENYPDNTSVMMEKIKHGEKVYHHETKRLTKDGKIIDISLTISPIKNTDGSIIGTSTIARDISRRKKMEEKLKETLKKLQTSNLELEQYAYVASHDLQEPLRMITSFLKLLQRRYAGQLDSNADEFIEYALDGATRMQDLIQDLLAYSRVTTKGKEFKDIKMEETLKQALINLKVSIEENDASITHDPLPIIYSDSSQMIQLLQNLIGNAIKYRSEESPQIHISAQKEDKQWLFRVKDNGIGIDPKYTERIFKIFQRLHQRDEFKGTGIGLAIAQKIVQRHGGEIWAESKPEKGSIFYFTIPN